jgi:hypothetical protein
MRHWRIPTVLGAAMMVGALAFATTALATPPNDHKVTICHATNSDTNPYVMETVDIASTGYVKAGHVDHTGPIWYEGAKDAHVKWGDIIPSYIYQPTSFTFPGLNWTDEGEAIWDNDCVPLTLPSPSASLPVDESTTPSTTTLPSPSFGQSVAGLTDAPTEPPTDTTTPISAPSSGASLLLALLGALAGSLLIVSPRASRGRQR